MLRDVRSFGLETSPLFQTHSLVIMDSNSFEILHSHELRANEQGASVLSAKLGNDPTPYIIVGTAITSPDEAEPKQVNCYTRL